MDEPVFDLIVAGGDIVDGTGARRFRGDVGIVADRIACIGELGAARSRRRVNARGMVVAPGFVDTHTHDDSAVMLWPSMPMKTSQGVTTVVIGNCGISLAPANLRTPPPPPLDLIGEARAYRFRTLASYLDYLDQEPPAVNVVALVGHMTLRASTMDGLDRPAGARERLAMKRMIDEAMDAGAVGISTGLAYHPSAAATTQELVDLASHVGRLGGLYCTHVRDEADGLLSSLCEACEVARRGRLPLVISHHKVMGRSNSGRSRQTLALLERAMKAQPLAIDAYPYSASSTVLKMDRVRQSTRVLITWSKTVPSAAGRDLAQIAAEMRCNEEEAVSRLQPAGAIYFVMAEADVQRILAWPGTMIGSDGLPQDASPHPRLWGTFPRVLGRYVRELGLLSLEEAIRRMTGLPAHVFGLRHRGRIEKGFFADMTVFDPLRIADAATYESPVTPSRGIELVLVNGRPVHDGTQTTSERSGRVLRRQQLDAPMAGFNPR